MTDPVDEVLTSPTAEPLAETELPADAPDVYAEQAQKLASRIEKLEAELQDAEARALRAQADAQTVRRRAAEENRRVRESAAENLVVELLPVLDNFERSLAHMESGGTVEDLKSGVLAVHRQLKSALEGVGVRRVESVGGPFDATYHDAIGTDVTDEHPEDTVTFEYEPAYVMGERVIRHARVKVAKPA